MTKRTFSQPLPSPGKNTTWPQDTFTKTGKIARSEANLPTMPFIRPRNSDKDEPATFTWTAVGRDGNSHDFFQTFTPGYGRKLPGPTADRVMRALLSMSPRKAGHGLEIRTSIKRLVDICNLTVSGETYDRIRQAIRRLQGVTIETNAFWDYDDQKYLNARRIELFAHHHFNTKGTKKMVQVRWSTSFANLMSTWTKPVDLESLFQLDTCLARKLYQISALNIYQQGEMVEDLKLLCHGQLGISQNRSTPSALKRSLKGPVKALRKANLIDIEFEKDEKSPSIKSDWLVRARPMKGMLDLREDIDDLQYWAFQLFGRGMMASKNVSLKECRKWVNKKGVSRARTAVKKWDQRSSGSDSSTESASSSQRESSSVENVSPEKATHAGSRSSLLEHSEGGERAAEEKIAIYLQLVDRKEHGTLHRRASRYIDRKCPGLGGARRRALINEAIGMIYLEKEGPESLPDPLIDQL